MKTKPAPSVQLLLMLPLRTVEIPRELERKVVTALADLIVLVAAGGSQSKEGGNDERKDP